MAMKYALAIAAAVGVIVTATAASAAKKHPRHVRPHAPAVVETTPSWGYASTRRSGCVQDEGYGRYTVCGQGPP